LNLTKYLNESIDRLFRRALRSSLTNPREMGFLIGALKIKRRAAKKRLLSAGDGGGIPPFMIASITTQCNLRCKGCYDRANRACANPDPKGELGAERWGAIFSEAEGLGISFILLAGGEPLKRPEVLERAAETRGVIFPVFTNGTLLSGDILGLFGRSRNLIPVVSVEGDKHQTDSRRGAGVFDMTRRAMREMKRRGIFFGCSVTVNKSNMDTVLGDDYVALLRSSGSRLVIYVEYVPVDGEDGLAPGEGERLAAARRLEELRLRFKDMILISFPGDEQELGGCLAAGRGFFHVNAFGGAEPCPFSPYSDTSLAEGSILRALDSDLFTKIRESGLGSEGHTGGCALFERRDAVMSLLAGG